MFKVFKDFSVICGGFLRFLKKFEIQDGGWRLFGHYVIIVTRYDVIIPRDVYQKIDVQTYYTPSKFLCHCSNILEVTEGGGGGANRTPGLNRLKNVKITKIRGGN